ncbi:hypothetical protein LTR37_005119 [Vermiconidia calcicola]|uniref:Uncharacterized protein n=1 Tax=Vermiconidia calcicola TaxID=1690605 RepID=A0ACC3NKI1_9PEZI|nr:hypothetical protein LTR37_005119 [Vermiconidia calcicola]
MAAPFFDIEESELTSLKDKVILITGCSSGIGLATVKLCLNAGAKVVGGDVNPCPHSSDSLIYERVDVTDWKSQAALFKKAIEAYGRVDHIFANAGIAIVDNFVTDVLDSDGELQPPNLRVIYSCKLGIHWLRKNLEGGSVVITGSASSFLPFFLTDYGVSKHAVLGLMRGLNENLAETKIRVNCVTPHWTATGLAPKEVIQDKLGITMQGPEAVAKSAMWLMAGESRRGQTIYSMRGRYREMDQVLLGAALQTMETTKEDGPDDPLAMKEMLESLPEHQ